MPREFKDILRDAHGHGYILHNLFQLQESIDSKAASGRWQSNWRTATGYYQYGQGDSAEEAMEDALQRARSGDPNNRPIPKHVKVEAPVEELML